jgi:hypothetical protein
MGTQKMKRMALVTLASLLLLYCVGYALCRQQRVIVHYTASVDGKCTFHDVAVSDYKLASPAPAIAFLYTPLRYVETAVWKLVKPHGSPC